MTTTNQTDIIYLAEKIFLQDVSAASTQDVATEVVAEAALWAAHIFHNAVTKYKAGELSEHFKRYTEQKDALDKAEALLTERRRNERRAAEIAEFDPIQHFMESLLRGIDQAKKAA